MLSTVIHNTNLYYFLIFKLYILSAFANRGCHLAFCGCDHCTTLPVAIPLQQSVLLKIKENGPVNCFSRIFGSCVLRPPQKDYFFAVPWTGSFGRILTMQLEPPKV